MKKIVSAICGAMILSSASAGTIDKVHIISTAMNKSSGAMLFIRTDGTKTSNPACSTNTSWTFVMPLNDKTDQQMMAMLLAAQASQSLVRLDGNGLCSVSGNIETLNVLFNGSP